MAQRVFVSHLHQGDVLAAYGYSTATNNIACKIVKKKKSVQTKPATKTKSPKRAHKHKDVHISTSS